ncbi:MAG TPA: hypothetical protein PLI16_05030 [Bacteroidales bacterium]|nr:hypothetical protein [Bacteroidales bacterium]HOH83956.1 hypothetical protein [Bacteroidales bacterium]
MKVTSLLYSIIYFAATAIILCIPALYNGYLLFDCDSALYVAQGIKLTPLVDRPIGYGYFIRATTWQSTLWMVIFSQGLIASLLIYHALKTVLIKITFNKLYHFITICFLSLFSTLGWFVSMLMPDILTSFLFLALFNILFGKNCALSYILYSVLIFFIVFSHLSNIPVLALLLITVWLFILSKRKFAEFKRKALLGSIMIMLVYLGTISCIIKYNYDHFKKPCLSTTSGIFFFARLIDTGVVDTYLKENCDKKDYRICKYKDDIPKWSQLFIWDTKGIFQKMGGWNNYQEEPKLIVKDILSSPKYYGPILWNFSLSTCKQSFQFRTGDGMINFLNEQWYPVYDNTYKNFPKNEIKRDFYNSKQLTEGLKFETINNVIYFIVILSILLIACVLYRFKIDDKIYLFLVICFSGVFFNAAVCANLSNVLNRYQARVVWIIPFIAIVLFLNYLLPKIITFLRKENLA